MKKLMIAAAAVALAGAVNAATYAWNGSQVTAYGTDPAAESFVGGTFYLMKGDATAAGDLVNAVLGAGKDYASTFATLVASAENYGTMNISDWVMTDLKQGTWNAEDSYAQWSSSDTGTVSFYQVLLDTEKNAIYVSEIQDVLISGMGNSAIELANTGTTTFDKTVKTYSESGWYTADVGGGGDVPEPTSAMLMLLGVAGLALRRKQK